MLKFESSTLNLSCKTCFFFPKRLLLSNLRRKSKNTFKLPNVKNKKGLFISNFQNINVELLTIFYTLVKCGNTKLAAEQLQISQPAISLALQKIEKSFRCLLFKPSSSLGKFRLTTTGLIFFNYIQRVFQIINESSKISPSSQLHTTFKNTYKHLYFANNPYYYKFSKKNAYYLKYKYENVKFLSNFNNHFFILSLMPSRLLLIKKKQIWLKKNCLGLSKNINSAFTIEEGVLIEVQTVQAFKLCLDLKVSSFIYWGN